MTFSEPWLFWGASWPFPRGFTTCVFPKHVDYNTLFAEEHCRKGTFSRGTGLRGRNSRSIAPLGFTISPKGTSLSAISRVWRHWELERGGHPSSVRLLLMPTSTAVRARYISSGATAVSWRSTHLPVQVQDLTGLPTANQASGSSLKPLKLEKVVCALTSTTFSPQVGMEEISASHWAKCNPGGWEAILRSLTPRLNFSLK